MESVNMQDNIEHSIITKYRKKIWRPFMRAICDYDMIKENDKVAVCISGGKDSFLLAKCMQELKLHGKVSFDLVFLVMDPGYSDTNLHKIIKNAEELNIPIEVVKSDIFAVSTKLDAKHPCYMCARMRRGFLYQHAKDLGCNKIALGHHFDDVVETILLSMFYGGEFKTMMPKLRSKNFTNMELIRPLYLVKESDIISFWENHNFTFIHCACSVADNVESNSKRLEIKMLLKELASKNPIIIQNIFKSSERVNLNTILSYEKDGTITSFEDKY